MTSRRIASAALLASRAMFVAAVTMLVLPFLRAARGEPYRQAVSASVTEVDSSTSLPSPRGRTASSFRFQSRDPFSPSRDAGGQPYRVSGSTSTAAVPVGSALPIRIVGTVVARERSFALVALTGEEVRAVYIGQRIDSFTLVEVRQGTAVFRADSGERVMLTVGRFEELR